jgi:hypothetical protein
METTIKIKTKHQVETEHEISLPHYTKSKLGTFFKIYGNETWDVIKVCSNREYLEVERTTHTIALVETSESNELEFNEAFEMAITQLKNIHK